MYKELPASPKRGEHVAIHWSRKRPALGLLITRQGEFFGVWNIAPVDGRPTARMFDIASTEAEARKIANRTWTEMGL